MKDSVDDSGWVAADVVDIIDRGCGLALMSPLRPGSTVLLRMLGEGRAADHRKASVRWCIGKSYGTFRAGLEFIDGRSAVALDESQPDSINPDKLDCYEVMQLSPHADRSVISQVYRMLAARYHPDNAETGNNEMFIRLSKAYQILSDPEKRAIYDTTADTRLRGKISDASASARRGGGERERLDTKGRVEGDRVRPSVGTLRGWNTAPRRS